MRIFGSEPIVKIYYLQAIRDSEDLKRTPMKTFCLHIGRHQSSVLITDDFEFIIIFCGWHGATLGGGIFLVGVVINYYARRKKGEARESKWARAEEGQRESK